VAEKSLVDSSGERQRTRGLPYISTACNHAFRFHSSVFQVLKEIGPPSWRPDPPKFRFVIAGEQNHHAAIFRRAVFLSPARNRKTSRGRGRLSIMSPITTRTESPAPNVIGSDNAGRPQQQDHPFIVSVYIAGCVNRGELAALDNGFDRESRKQQKEEHSGRAYSSERSRTSALSVIQLRLEKGYRLRRQPCG
jgi:hypothetical protein